MPDELLALCEQKEILVHGHVILTIPYRKHRSARVRLLPGVLGRVVGSDSERLILDVAVVDIKRYLIKHLSNIEGYALGFAEAGNFEEADRWLAQYVAVRDRLGATGMWRSLV